MPVEGGYKVAVVIVDQHEPEGETAGRLLEIADGKGYSARVVEAQRGEHDAGLSFRVPEDVAKAFNADRSERWPLSDESDETEDADGDPDNQPNRKARGGKAPAKE